VPSPHDASVVVVELVVDVDVLVEEEDDVEEVLLVVDEVLVDEDDVVEEVLLVDVEEVLLVVEVLVDEVLLVEEVVLVDVEVVLEVEVDVVVVRVHTDGLPPQVQSGSTVQVGEHPSPAVRSPSSQASPGSTMALPQVLAT
jgi:hypothetical protein